MGYRRFLHAMLAVFILAGQSLASMAQAGPWVEPDLDAQLNQILGDHAPLWLVMGEWKEPGGSSMQIASGAKVICVGSDKVIVIGTHQWTGTYDASAGKLDVKRAFSADEVTALENKQNAPDWARKAIAGKAVREEMLMTVTVQKDGSLSIAGKIYGEKVDWEEQVDEKSGQPVSGSQKAWIITDSDATRDLPTYTKAGISKESRDKLKQALHLLNLLQHRKDLNENYLKQIQQLEKSYEALKSSTGADEQQRLDQTGKSIDSARKSWQQDLNDNTNEIIGSAQANSSYYNSEVQDILAKYAQVKQSIAQDPQNTLYPKVMSDTETRLLLYLGQGANAVYNHDYNEQLAFMFSMVKSVVDMGHGAAVGATSAAVNSACPAPENPTPSRTRSGSNVMDTDLDAELVAARNRTGVPKATNGKVTGGTIAVSKSSVPGLDGGVYEGKSGSLYQEWPWNEPGDYESTNPVGQRHAEADIANQWERDLQAAYPLDAGYSAKGDIELHIEQPMCSSCAAGLKEGDVFPGTIGQFSQNHPDIDIHVTNAADPNGTVLVVSGGSVVAKSFPVQGH